MNLKSKLEAEQRLALKVKARTFPGTLEGLRAESRLLAIRGALAAIGEAETAGKTRTELSDADVLSVLKKEIAKRRDSADIYTRAGETERAAAEIREQNALAEFVPKEVSETELRLAIKVIVAEHELQGQGGRAIGVVMGQLHAKFPNFDTKRAATIIRELTS